jgi:beta-1,2-mannosidase
VGQALFSAADPTRLLARTPHPFFQPKLPWEQSGQYAAGTTFAEGLVWFDDHWLLYYGCADQRVGVAITRRDSPARSAVPDHSAR